VVQDVSAVSLADTAEGDMEALSAVAAVLDVSAVLLVPYSNR
jgi:hypothetical protein